MSMSIRLKGKLPKRSPLGLLVLWYLVGEPMHAYRMQKLIEAQGKHRVVNVRSPASLYQTIKRLEHHGLIKIKETVRDSNLPDRTVYAVTDAGRQAAREWLHASVSETGGEYPEFLAAVSMLFALPPDEARGLLEKRAKLLAADLAEAEAELAANTNLPRLFLLEEEYRRAVLQAEVAWVRAVCAEIRFGQLSWDESWIRGVGAKFNPPADQE